MSVLSAANLSKSLDIAERLMRLGLKAQSQARATLETLAQIKNPPVVYARQANVASGPQQNNFGVPSRVQTEINQSQLSESSMSYVRTPEHRALRAALIRRWKPWEKSTGPRSAEGKARSAMRGYKGGQRHQLRALAQFLRELGRALDWFGWRSLSTCVPAQMKRCKYEFSPRSRQVNPIRLDGHVRCNRGGIGSSRGERISMNKDQVKGRVGVTPTYHGPPIPSSIRIETRHPADPRRMVSLRITVVDHGGNELEMSPVTCPTANR